MMTKILVIAWKELYTTLRDRNLILIMFLTPIVLSTIMGLAFGGFGGSGSQVFADIPIAVVNLDEGFDLQAQLGATAALTDASLDQVEFTLGGETINLGEQLQQNANLALTDQDLSASNASFNFGELVASILLSQPFTTTNGDADGIELDALSCPLVEDDAEDDEAPFGFEGTLDDLFAAVALNDVDAARAGVDAGDYVAAVIIPPGFSHGIFPLLGFATDDAMADEIDGLVAIYASDAQPISASIVRAVVEGIVNQLMRMGVAVEAVLTTGAGMLLSEIDPAALEQAGLDMGQLTGIITESLQTVDASLLAPLSCLLLPGAGTVTLVQQPLDELQTVSSFAFIMVVLGGAQAIFFALFTGIFGVNSIYQERDQWTLQRLLVSPTPRVAVLAGKLLGNLTVVVTQLLVLFTSFTVIVSLVEGGFDFIWGTNILAFLLVVLGIGLFASGVGVLVVGLARTPEQVQFMGPMIATTLGALGGSFGFRLPPEVARFSPIWWGTDALQKLAIGEPDIGLNLLMLFGAGFVLFALGTVLFKRRLDL